MEKLKQPRITLEAVLAVLAQVLERFESVDPRGPARSNAVGWISTLREVALLCQAPVGL